MTKKMMYQSPEVLEVFEIPMAINLLEGSGSDVGFGDYEEGGEMEEG